MVEKIKQFIENLNKYIGLVVIIPALLGGIWQVLELANISPSFIRFFSVTQIASDGSLILFVFLIVFFVAYLPYRLMNFRYTKTQFDEDTKNETHITDKKVNKNPKLLKIISIIMLIILVALTYFFVRPVILKAYEDFSLNNFAIAIWWSIVMISFFSVIVRLHFQLISESNPQIKHHFLNFITRQLGKGESSLFLQIGASIAVIVIFYLVMNIIFLIGAFRNLYLLPANLKNVENIECYVKKDFPQLSSIKIAYFNDKYFFAEVTDNSQKRYFRVIKFDELFNNNCKESKTN